MELGCPLPVYIGKHRIVISVEACTMETVIGLRVKEWRGRMKGKEAHPSSSLTNVTDQELINELLKRGYRVGMV